MTLAKTKKTKTSSACLVERIEQMHSGLPTPANSGLAFH